MTWTLTKEREKRQPFILVSPLEKRGEPRKRQFSHNDDDDDDADNDDDNADDDGDDDGDEINGN